MCKEHRAAQEVEARKARIEEQTGKPCAVEGCDKPRHVTPSQVLSYCLEHRQAKAREIDTAKRRRDGAPERALVIQPDDLPAGHKLCGGPCGQVKPFEEFHARPGAFGDVQGVCKVCQHEAQAERLREPERRDHRNAVVRSGRRQQMYDLGPTLERLLLEEQEFACAGCRLPFAEKDGKLQYVVDHVRGTKDDVRGLLHSGCNTAIGLANDHDPVSLLGLSIYLQRGLGAVPNREKLTAMWERIVSDLEASR
jgi:hypothetical protein